MALKGTRGRFSDDDYVASSKESINSRLKSLGKNPTYIVGNLSYLSNIKDEKKLQEKSKKELEKKAKKEKNAKKINYRQREMLEKLKRDRLRIKVNPDSKNIKDRITYVDRNPRHEVIKKKLKKNINYALIALMIVVETFTLGAIYIVGTAKRIQETKVNITINKEEIKNKELPPEVIKVMEGYKTVLLFGLDSRNGSLSKGSNADVIMIANLNLETGDAQLVSIYRDDYLKVSNSSMGYDKINASYRKGGPEQAIKDINDNLDLNITEFFAFNWKAVADGINLLGGVDDINITQKEYTYMNAFIHETCKGIGGEDAKNPAAHYIKSVGPQHLDGIQAVAYGRLRLMDSDYQRTERQKLIISRCLDKAKTKSFEELYIIANYIMPQVAFNFDITNDLWPILRIVNKIRITDTSSFPKLNNLKQTYMGASLDCVVPLNLEKGVKELHESLFGAEDYKPSSKVHSYSVRITELRRNYEAQNDQKKAESVQAEAEANQLVETAARTNTNTNNTKSTSETKVDSTNANGEVIPEIPGSSNNKPPTSNGDTYEDEPESDVVVSRETPRETTKETTKETAKETTIQTPQNTGPMGAPIIAEGPTGPGGAQGVVVPGAGPPGSGNTQSGGGVVVGSGPPT